MKKGNSNTMSGSFPNLLDKIIELSYLWKTFLCNFVKIKYVQGIDR
jgi:hypothetical protein